MLFALLFLGLVPAAFLSDGFFDDGDDENEPSGNGLDRTELADVGDFISGNTNSADTGVETIGPDTSEDRTGTTDEGTTLEANTGPGNQASPDAEQTLLDQLLGTETDANYGRETMANFMEDTDPVEGTSEDDVLILEDDGVEGTGSGDVSTHYGTAVVESDETVAVVSGGEGDDFIQTGDDAAYAFGGDGNDMILGGEGAMAAFGGAGEDYIDATTSGGSVLDGGDGNDVIIGGAEDDILRGGAHGDSASEDNDYLDGGAGDDIIDGGLGADTIYGGDGNDVIDHYGHALEDSGQALHSFDWHIDGEADQLDGGAGDDMLIFDQSDVATGGEGADVFWLYADPEAQVGSAQIMDFVPGEDFLKISLDPELDAEGITYDVQPSEDGEDGIVSVNGETVAVLVGMPNATVDDVYVEISEDITA